MAREQVVAGSQPWPGGKSEEDMLEGIRLSLSYVLPRIFSLRSGIRERYSEEDLAQRRERLIGAIRRAQSALDVYLAGLPADVVTVSSQPVDPVNDMPREPSSLSTHLWNDVSSQ